MRTRLVLAAGLGALAGCFSPSYSNPTCPTGECPDGLTCVANVCVAAPPDIDASVAIIDAALDAAVDGTDAVDDILFLDPVNELPGTGDWIINGTVELNTDMPMGLPVGVTTTEQVAAAAGARPILVVHVRKLTVMAGAQLLMFGTRPVAIVAGDDVLIAGVLDASAPGPGSFPVTASPAAGGRASPR